MFLIRIQNIPRTLFSNPDGSQIPSFNVWSQDGTCSTQWHQVHVSDRRCMCVLTVDSNCTISIIYIYTHSYNIQSFLYIYIRYMFCWFSSLFCRSQSETGVKVVGVWRCANSNQRPEITWMAEIRMSNKESLENWCLHHLHRWFCQQCFSFPLIHFPLWFVIPFNGTPKLIDSIQSASVSDKDPVSQFFFLAWE